MKIPEYIKGNKANVFMDKNPNKRKVLFKDHLCVLLKMEEICLDMRQGVETEDFPGNNLGWPSWLWRVFWNQCEWVPAVQEWGSHSIVQVSKNTMDTLNLNTFEQHFSYIKDLKKYCEKCECETCGMLFKTSPKCLKHYKVCKNATKYVYLGGFHQSRTDVVDQLGWIGVHSEVPMSYP